MGDLQPDIDVSGQFSDESMKRRRQELSGSDLDLENDSFYNKYDEKLKRKFERLGGFKQQQRIAKNCSESSRAVVKFWVMRARLR